MGTEGARACEVYEDSAGTLHLFVTEGGDVAWAARYFGDEDVAAADYCGIVVQGLDPVAEGWEGMPADLAAADFEQAAAGRPLASTLFADASDPLGIDLGGAGLAGERFVRALLEDGE